MSLLQASVLIAACGLLRVHSPLHTAVAFGLTGYAVTAHLIPKLGPSFMKVGLKGKDMLKHGQSSRSRRVWASCRRLHIWYY
ncbi:hypothetical protein HF325_000626 [Metschnikowia pulcherrima]|uniref:Uncharacterized protein n=1 Tax=Metschnikowia pulcherrima TaxID=27326 RepID=A0A8H7GWR0_9ASCO|nr:hypothetical protein HF325_000626 [Metschnikowia pulcherrima]